MQQKNENKKDFENYESFDNSFWKLALPIACVL